MNDVDAEEFERLVIAELDLLPDDMMDGLQNLSFTVEDLPGNGDEHLLALYHGVALTERDNYGYGELPDLITLYRLPLLAVSRDLEELRREIHVTLVHEIGHFYGLDDEELNKLGWA